MKYLTKNNYWDLQKEYNTDKILYLLIDRPSTISRRDFFTWTNNKNEFHRDYDLPAIVQPRLKLIEWNKNNKKHRDNDTLFSVNTENNNILYMMPGVWMKQGYDKPAVIIGGSDSALLEYYINDKFIKKQEINNNNIINNE